MNNPCASSQVAQNALVGQNPIAVPAAPAVAVKLLDTNPSDRKELIIQNVGVAILYLGLGFQPTATIYSIALQACASAHDGSGGVYVSDNWKGSVMAVGNVAGGLAAVTEEV